MKTWIIIISVLFQIGPMDAFSQEICSRVAIINHQEVLVDTNSTQKGEGLRYHLEKDPVARSYLDLYQKGTQIQWHSALLGTIGTGLAAAGLLNNKSETKRTLLISGLSLILVNFLVAKTLEHENENNLTQAIKEYNKRNLPHIYFNPGKSDNRRDPSNASSVTIQKQWDF